MPANLNYSSCEINETIKFLLIMTFSFHNYFFLNFLFYFITKLENILNFNRCRFLQNSFLQTKKETSFFAYHKLLYFCITRLWTLRLNFFRNVQVVSLFHHPVKLAVERKDLKFVFHAAELSINVS